MIKFALNIKLRYMLRKVLSLLFLIGFLVNSNLIAQTNTPPVAMNDGNSLDEGGIVTGNVLNNDDDADGDPIIVVSHSLPGHGSVVVKPTGEYEYTHNGDEEFADEFQYTIFDGTDKVTATVTFTINPCAGCLD